MIDGYNDNFSTSDRPRPIYVKPVDKPAIYITNKWLDEKKDQYTNVFIDDKPLIRCKDCKYKVVTKDGEWNPEDIVCDYWASDGLEADDFCSRGERE